MSPRFLNLTAGVIRITKYLFQWTMYVACQLSSQRVAYRQWRVYGYDKNVGALKAFIKYPRFPKFLGYIFIGSIVVSHAFGMVRWGDMSFFREITMQSLSCDNIFANGNYALSTFFSYWKCTLVVESSKTACLLYFTLVIYFELSSILKVRKLSDTGSSLVCARNSCNIWIMTLIVVGLGLDWYCNDRGRDKVLTKFWTPWCKCRKTCCVFGTMKGRHFAFWSLFKCLNCGKNISVLSCWVSLVSCIIPYFENIAKKFHCDYDTQYLICYSEYVLTRNIETLDYLLRQTFGYFHIIFVPVTQRKSIVPMVTKTALLPCHSGLLHLMNHYWKLSQYPSSMKYLGYTQYQQFKLPIKFNNYKSTSSYVNYPANPRIKEPF